MTLYIVCLIGGLLAGIINALAGNGSVITLSILTELMGLPANVANGTNRIGVLANAIGASGSFYKNDKLEISKNKYAIILLLIGSLSGLWAALVISNEDFRSIFGGLLIVMFFVTIIKPERWIKEKPSGQPPSDWVLWLLYFALGFYGGFIQMGMGIFFLAVTVLVAKMPMANANGLKSFSIAIYTLIVLIIFSINGMVSWQEGAILAVGQAVGGWLGGSFGAKHPKANVVTYWLLVCIVIVAIIHVFGLHKIFF